MAGALPTPCVLQEGDTAYIRINFNFGPTFEPGTRYPKSIFVKELSYRSADSRHAAKASRRGEGLCRREGAVLMRSGFISPSTSEFR